MRFSTQFFPCGKAFASLRTYHVILSTWFTRNNTGRGFLAPREPWTNAACAKYPSFKSKGKLVNSRAGDEKIVEIRCEPSSHSVARSSQPRQQQQASPSVRVVFTFVCSVHVRSRFHSSYVGIVACRMKKLKSKNDPLPITSKFCCLFELQPSVTIYIFGEFLVWTLLLLTSLNLELKCLDTTDLSEFHAVLDENWYYNLIFGQPDPIPHDNARCEWNQSI